MFFGSRSLEGEKVEEPEPLRSGERTTGRAAWVVVCVFGWFVGLLGAGLGLVLGCLWGLWMVLRCFLGWFLDVCLDGFGMVFVWL